MGPFVCVCEADTRRGLKSYFMINPVVRVGLAFIFSVVQQLEDILTTFPH